ncbi:MAG: hypothetical protein IT204_21415 [Fimbriimonadaceae bacterium]|nr:hypothetical protein [Fimbriimonadaceae bacterium]
MAANPWHAHWLWAAGPRQQYRQYTNTYALLRCQVDLPAAPRQALVKVTADTRYRLLVNSQSVLRGPARGYPRSWPYDQMDLTPFLRPGANVLAIVAHCVGDDTFQSEFDGRPGVLLEGAVTLLTGDVVRLDTHPLTWEAHDAVAWRQHVGRFSVQTGWQEDCDLTALPAGWLLPGPVAGFGPPADLGPHPQPPWMELEPRGLPLLKVTELLPEAVVGVFHTASAAGWREVVDLSEPLVSEDWQADPRGVDLDGDVLTVDAPGDDRAVAVVFDLGLTCLGYPSVGILRGGDGLVVDLAYAERLLPSGFIATRPPAWTQPRHVDRFRVGPAGGAGEVFGLRGTRYLAVILRGGAGEVLLRRPRLAEISYPAEQRGLLQTGDEVLDRVWKVGLTTLRRNMTDAYTDCPWREQAQWWGDARVEFLINAYTLGDTAVLARGIRQAAQSQLSNGLLYGVFPGKAAILPDYNFVWVETLWDHYLHTGSDQLLRQWADVLRRNLAWFREHTDASGLLDPPDGTWLFLDWANVYKGKYSTVYNLRYLQALHAAAQVFRQIGADVDADACVGRGMLVALALTQRVFDRQSGRWHDGYVAETGERLPQLSAHAQALAILLGLEPQTHDRLCREVLLPVLRGERADVIEPSPFFSAFVLEALLQCGYDEAVLDIIRRRWGAWLAAGHRTWPELWHSDEVWNDSLCHAWSGSPTWLLSQLLLGVTLLEPGWRRIRIAPRRAGLTQVSGAVPTPAGEVLVSWRVHHAQWQIRVQVPQGATALLDLGEHGREELAAGQHEVVVEL